MEAVDIGAAPTMKLPSATLPLCAAAALLAAMPAQEEFAAFRQRMDERLKAHPFFGKVKTIRVERPPFLFYVEKAPDDASDYELGVVNGYLPFLHELTRQFEAKYRQPAALQRHANCGGYAIAVLSSAGRYMDFRTAVGDPSLANMRAHYTPDLQLAVTYLDAFARHNTKTEDLHALLHEFVHALQHAHSPTGQMTRPVFYNEGFAEFRSGCTNVASSLADPQVDADHVAALRFARFQRAGKPYFAPLVDLVAANSYREVLEAAQRRAPGGLRTELALAVFYAQSALFVRFLHEGANGSRLPQFLRYLDRVQKGGSGVALFQEVFACERPDAVAALDQEWTTWLDALIRQKSPDLPPGELESDTNLAPPIAFADQGLQWQPNDFPDRFAGARRLCGRGHYDSALSMLPAEGQCRTPAESALLQRERQRILALLELREKVLAEVERSKGQVAVGGTKGKFVRRTDRGSFVLQVGKEEREVPLTAWTPTELRTAGNRLKPAPFDGKAGWIEVWLRYLEGEPLAKLKDKLDKGYSTYEGLRTDLVADLDAEQARGAEALAELQGLPRTNDAAEASRCLQRAVQLLADHRGSPLLQQRRPALDELVRAYAERCFRADDLDGLGITGKVTKLADGRIQVVYDDPSKAPTADFTPVPEDESKWLNRGGRVPYGGPAGITAWGKGYQLGGSALLRWIVPMAGRQSVAFDLHVQTAQELDFFVAMGAHAGGALFATPVGSVQVLQSNDAEIDPRPIGGGAMLATDRPNKLQFECDGEKSLVVTVNGKAMANVDAQGFTSGELWLFLRLGSPPLLTNLTITGRPSPRDLGKLRAQFVARCLKQAWG